jgi:PAS domain S-box-containing protein
MVRVLSCVVEQHNLWLVAVSGVICVLCWAGALLVMDRVRGAANNGRAGWLVLAAFAAGGGTWATHFVGILAYEPGVPTSFDFGIALLSAAIGVGGALAAFAVFARWANARGAVAAGLLMGGAIAGLHHLGMAGIEVAAHRVWASDLLIASALFVAAFSVLGFWALARAESFSGRVLAGALFVFGVLSLHFTAVGALTLVPYPLTKAPEPALDHSGLAIMIVVGAAALLLAAATFSFSDRRIAAARLANAVRVSRLAEAALEGLVIHDGDTILDANTALAKMVGAEVGDLVGNSMRAFVAPDSLPALQAAARGERAYPVEATLVSPRGLVEVEIHRRVLNAAEGTYVSAVRDISMRRRAERERACHCLHDAA